MRIKNTPTDQRARLAPSIATAWAMERVSEVFAGLGYDAELTCQVEGRHGRGSLHFAERAFDVGFKTYDRATGLRLGELTENEKREVLRLAKLKLGDDFDAVAESDHFHFEYQPKVGVNLG